MPGMGPGDVIEKAHAQVLPALTALQSELGSPVLTYFLDDAISAAIADEQVLQLYEHLRRLGHRPTMVLWLNSRGGATEVPGRVISLLREFTDRLTVAVPYRAHSAATLICLGADEILMSELSELGPVDPSRNHPLLPKEEGSAGKPQPIPISVQDLRHLLKFLEREMGKDALTGPTAGQVFTALFEKMHPLAIGALEQSWTLAQQICEQVLKTHMAHSTEGELAEIRSIVDRLSDHYKSHLYQIDRGEAERIGLKVRRASDHESQLMWDLLRAYASITVEAKLELGAGQKAIGRRLGHIDSAVGASLGLMLLTEKQPPEVLGSRWDSWFPEPAAAPLGLATPLPPETEA